MGYVTAEELEAAGVMDASAPDFIELASLMIDAHVRYPINEDGYKFPRAASAARGLDADAAVPAGIKKAVIEQVRWIVTVVGYEYVQRGGDDAQSVSTPNGGSETRSRTDMPLLAPLAKMYLKPYMGSLGYIA